MKKMAMTARIMALGCAMMAGAGVCLLLMPDLMSVSTLGQSAGLSCYAALFSDTAVSLLAGFLTGWLVHFCIWHFPAGWLGNLWLHRKNKLQLGDGGAPGVEQTG